MTYQWPYEGTEEIARALEVSETPRACPRAILRSELLTPYVWDAACGRGICAEAAKEAGYQVYASDVYDWGYGDDRSLDFVNCDSVPEPLQGKPFSVFSNFPFALACDFVENSFRLGARKVVLFHRQGWVGSQERGSFWGRFPYQRCYVIRPRVSCYWFWFSPQERYRMNSGSTDYCWYVFEQGQNCRFQMDFVDCEERDFRLMPGIAHSEFDVRLEDERLFYLAKHIKKVDVAAE